VRLKARAKLSLLRGKIMSFSRALKLNLTCILLVCLTFSCSESSPSPVSAAPTTLAGEQPGPQGADALCAGLQNAGLATARLQTFVNELCQSGKLTQLRRPENVYRGLDNTPPNIDIQAQQGINNRTNMVVYTSMMVPADPQSYFNMLRLKVTRPTDFRNTFQHIDPNISYEVLQNSGAQVSYRYKYDSDVFVDYEANATFKVVQQGQLYIVKTRSFKGHETLEDLTGMIIINGRDEGGKKVSEVFSLSDQRFDNRGDHEQSISQARNRFSNEVNLDYKNSLQAQSANSFFQ